MLLSLFVRHRRHCRNAIQCAGCAAITAVSLYSSIFKVMDGWTIHRAHMQTHRKQYINGYVSLRSSIKCSSFDFNCLESYSWHELKWQVKTKNTQAEQRRQQPHNHFNRIILSYFDQIKTIRKSIKPHFSNSHLFPFGFSFRFSFLFKKINSSSNEK